MYDGILSIRKPRGVEPNFADDVAVIAVPKTIPEWSNVSIRAVIEWLEKVGLRIAAHKTEVVEQQKGR